MNTALTAEQHIDKLKEISRTNLSLSDTKKEIAACIGTVSLDMQCAIVQIMDSHNSSDVIWPYIRSYIQGNIENGGIALDPMRDTRVSGSSTIPSITNTSSDQTNTNNIQSDNTITPQTTSIKTESKVLIEKIKKVYNKRATDITTKTQKHSVSNNTGGEEANRFNTKGTWIASKDYGMVNTNEYNTNNQTGGLSLKQKVNSKFQKVDYRVDGYNQNGERARYTPHQLKQFFGSNKSIFNANIIKDNSLQDMKLYYKANHLATLPLDEQDTIKQLTNQMVSENTTPIKEETIVSVPLYAKESSEGTKKLISAIQSEQGDFKAVIYVNANETNCTQNDISNKVSEIKSLIGSDKRFTIISKLYKDKKTIGHIRADLIDSITYATDASNTDPVVVQLDADTWKIQPGYITGISSHIKKSNCSYAVGKIRRCDTDDILNKDKNPSILLSERLLEMRYPRQSGDNTPSSGAASAYKLNDYLKVKGYNRNSKVFEDVELGRKMIAFYENNNTGTPYNKKVYVDDRRGAEALIKEGMRFGDMRTGEFSPIEKRNNPDNVIKEIDSILIKIGMNEQVSSEEIEGLEEFINMHLRDQLPDGRITYINQDLMKYTEKFLTYMFRKSSYNVQITKEKGIKITLR